jgi:signal transduction histidine kinase
VTTTAGAARRSRRRPLRLRPTAGRKHWPLAGVFVAGAGIAALVAVCTVALGAVALWRLGEARAALLDEAGPALLAVKDLSNAQIDQETGVRGFLLTGQPQFLEPYRAGVERSADAANRLRASAEVLPEIGPAVGAALLAEQDWRAAYADLVVAVDPTAPGLDAGRAFSDRMRSATGELEVRLEALRQGARAEMTSALSFIAAAGVAIGVTLLVLLALVGFGLRRMVLRPVSDLAAQVREVVAGDTDRRVEVDGPGEIRELGADIDAMRRHILRELDEAQAVNRRLDDQARELERSNRDLEQFAYVASHDLQEPLRKVASFCQLLQRRYAGRLDQRADHYIAVAVDGAQRMQRLIDGLLAFSRVGRTTEGFVTVDLGAVVAAAAAQLEPARKATRGEIVVPGALPAVAGDAGLLQSLFMNLIGNGLKFHRKGVAPVVRVEARRDGASWVITVTDNGIGIGPEDAEKIFVIFQRLHGRDEYPGTGIGLALAKKIVEFHRGDIGLVPGDGPGTTIRITLPVPAEGDVQRAT